VRQPHDIADAQFIAASSIRRHDRRAEHQPGRKPMSQQNIKEGMEVIGADGVHVGTVDRIEGNRIKLKKHDSGAGLHKGHHHYIELGFVAGVEGAKVRLSANAAIAVTLEEEKSGKPVDPSAEA
jgi:hypothetical protein